MSGAGTIGREDRRAVARLVLAAARHHPSWCALLAVTGVLGSIAATALPAAVGETFDLVLARRDAAGWLVACVALVVGGALCDVLTDLASGTVTANSTAWLRRRLLRHILGLGPHGIEGISAGDLVGRLVGNTADAGATVVTACQTLSALVPPLGGIVALCVIDPWLALVCGVGFPLTTRLLRRFMRDVGQVATRYQQAQGAIAARLVETIGGARTIAAAATHDRERDRVLEPLPELSAAGHGLWRVHAGASARGGVLVPLLQIGVVAVAGLRMSAGHLAVGELLAAARYASLTTGIGVLVEQANAMARDLAATRRLVAVERRPPIRYGTRALPPGPGRLVLRGVSARRGDRLVLDGVDLVVEGGESLAVVGASGSGKSLLMAVVGRLAEPAAGEILLDGVPVAELDHAGLRREVGYAFDRPALFGETVHDAIDYGADRPDAETVRAAARAARADGFVRRLPDGYATPLPGVPLSGGEYQRLGLARTFAHAGRLLLLDDATSSLDMATELAVDQALGHDTGGATRLVVAHRASVAARCDRVAWLAAGRVRAVGPHDELWRDPAYRALFQASEPAVAPGRESADHDPVGDDLPARQSPATPASQSAATRSLPAPVAGGRDPGPLRFRPAARDEDTVR